jgi:FkbH-like protein
VRVAPRFPLTEEYGDEYWDDRMSKLTGSAYSDSALIAQARDLGLGWIPAALSPRLKVVAVDLDNTLYQGVLGEDGIAGVSIAGDFRKIQERLRNLHRQGILLAVVSRNEREDVDALFATRSDFPLRRDHCSVVEAGWGGKADALEKIAGRLRVGLDSVLFVDDNLGELAAVAEALPPVRLAHARSPEQTLALLRHGPGLLRWAEGGEDALRAQDLAVADVREGIAKQGREKGDYLGALGVEVAFAANAASHVERLAELSGKTNQFNLALQRYSAHAVSELQKANDWICITANVKDRLSDSGVVFAMVAKWEADVFRVEELCISCRALGRGLEDMLVVEAIQESLRRRPARRVAFKHRTGPRNAPARDWLERFVGERLAPEGQCDMNWDVALWGARTRDLPVIWRWV